MSLKKFLLASGVIFNSQGVNETIKEPVASTVSNINKSSFSNQASENYFNYGFKQAFQVSQADFPMTQKEGELIFGKDLLSLVKVMLTNVYNIYKFENYAKKTFYPEDLEERSQNHKPLQLDFTIWQAMHSFIADKFESVKGFSAYFDGVLRNEDQMKGVKDHFELEVNMMFDLHSFESITSFIQQSGEKSILTSKQGQKYDVTCLQEDNLTSQVLKSILIEDYYQAGEVLDTQIGSKIMKTNSV